ncbi:ATP-binding protein [Wenjunlia tyrosinilytica]|uniref:ATP-binding protein n=1 Tax=Wenjunlia tyrosinilytica TaxID=1544741 RepID=UPI00166B776B|nr:ATP-binding protein [Wenjunlia tyrosinilytica]
MGDVVHHAAFPPLTARVGSVRRYVRTCAARFGVTHRFPMDDVALVVSEMFANATTHADNAGSDVTVAIGLSGPLLRLEVHDLDPRPCVPAAASGTDDSGRGMLLIAALSQRWGMIARHRGKIVFAEIAPHTEF